MVNKLHYLVDITLIVLPFGLPWVFNCSVLPLLFLSPHLVFALPIAFLSLSFFSFCVSQTTFKFYSLSFSFPSSLFLFF